MGIIRLDRFAADYLLLQAQICAQRAFVWTLSREPISTD